MQLQFLLNEFLITSASKVERLQSKCPYAFSTKLHLSFIFQSFLPLWRISEACDATPDYVVSQLSRRPCLQRRLCTCNAATAAAEKRSTQTHEAKCTTKGTHIIAGGVSLLDKWTVSFSPKWNKKLGGLNLFRLTDFLGVANWVCVARRPFVRFIFTSGPSVCFQGFFFFSLLPYLDGALVITSHAHFVFSIRRTSWIICPETTLIFLFF